MVRVRLDYREMGRLLSSDQVRGPLREIAQEMADRGRSSAPVDTGEYRSRIDVQDHTWSRGSVRFAVERVVAHASHSIIVEARTGNLKRALGGG